MFTDPVDFISAIHKAGVRYVLIGRQAMISWGIPVQTIDYDLYIDGSEDNTEKFLEVARRFDLFPSKPLSELKKHFVFRLENDIVIDVFRAKQIGNQAGEIISFEDLYNRRQVLEDKEGFAVNVPCLEDLIKLKKTGREKDAYDIRYLEKIRDDIPVKRC